MMTAQPNGAQRAQPAAPAPAIPRDAVAAAFLSLRQALELPEVKPPTFGALVRAAWAAANVLRARCDGGENFPTMRSERRKIVALAVAWAESVAVSQTALQLAVALPPVGGRDD